MITRTTGQKDASFESFNVVMFQVEVFWIVTPCIVVVGYRRFRGPCCLHLLGCDAVHCCRISTFQRSMLPPSSEDSSRGLLGCDCCGRIPTFQMPMLSPSSG
jgi:hypothetical protein